MKKIQSKEELVHLNHQKPSPNENVSACDNEGDKDFREWLTNIKQKANIRRAELESKKLGTLGDESAPTTKDPQKSDGGENFGEMCVTRFHEGDPYDVTTPDTERAGASYVYPKGTEKSVAKCDTTDDKEPVPTEYIGYYRTADVYITNDSTERTSCEHNAMEQV